LTVDAVLGIEEALQIEMVGGHWRRDVLRPRLLTSFIHSASNICHRR
jgi:hypothetical protein